MKKPITTTYTDSEFRVLVKDELKNILKEALEEKPTTGARAGIMHFKDAISYLRISKSTLYKLVHENKIKYSKQGPKRLIFRQEDLDEWLLRHKNLDMNGTSPDGWNEKEQRHMIYEQPPSWWVK